MRDGIPTQQIVDALEDRLEELVAVWWPGGVKQGAVLYPCPGKADLGSFQVFLAQHGKYVRGEWRRFSQGRGGGVLNLIAYGISGELDHKPSSYAPAIQWAKRWLGLDRPETEAERRDRERRQEAGRRKREADAARAAARQVAHVGSIWKAGAPVMKDDAACPVVRYLTGEPRFVAGRNVGNRGLDLEAITTWCAPLRYAEDLRHWTARVSLPAMVAAVAGQAGRLQAVHCTFLDPAGDGKAKRLPKAASTKLMRGNVEGGVVPIAMGPTGNTLDAAAALGRSSPLIIAEGIETAIAIASAVDEARVVAALSITNIGNLVWLAAHRAVSSVVVAIENDVKPQAIRERDRVIGLLEDGSGKPVHTMRSHVGSDFADAY